MISMQKPPLPEKAHRINRDIRFSQIRVIGPTGEQLGVMSPDEGRQKAFELGLDLIEVQPEARPPVCKIMDYGKFKYELSKKSKPQKTSQLKTIQLGTKISDHDLTFKLEQAKEFLSGGDRVRFIMKMKGRENTFADKIMAEFVNKLKAMESVGKLVNQPTFEGKTIFCQYDPK